MKRGKTFNPTEQARLLPLIIPAVRESSTIGDMEQLAGIPQEQASRAAFWAPFLPIDKAKGVQACFDAAMAECRRLIAANMVWVAL